MTFGGNEKFKTFSGKRKKKKLRGINLYTHTHTKN